MQKPLFSIIIPMFNVRDYIGRCIESIEKQVFLSWELIIVDDGSSDDSLSICKKYAFNDERIRVFTQNNMGVSSARNKGLEEAKGDYVAFIDGDDYWEDKYYLWDIASITPVDVIYSPNLIRQYPNGSKKRDIVSIDNFENKTKDSPLNFLARNIKKNRWGCVFFVISRKVIEYNRTRFDTRIMIGEDADWVFKTIDSAKTISIVPNVNYVYQVNRMGSAMTNIKIEALLSFFKMTKDWKERSEKFPYMRPIYIMFCNNAMEYFQLFGNYSEEDQSILVYSLKESGAYVNSNSSGSYYVKKTIKKMGFKRGIKWMAIKHRLKSVCAIIKGKILVIFSR